MLVLYWHGLNVGHEAFINMRYRGTQTTDMVILVVSAVDGIQQ